MRRSVELILQREIDDVVLDLLWGIFSHEVYGMLVLDRGLDRAQYAERMRSGRDRVGAGGLTPGAGQTPRRRARAS